MNVQRGGGKEEGELSPQGEESVRSLAEKGRRTGGGRGQESGGGRGGEEG